MDEGDRGFVLSQDTRECAVALRAALLAIGGHDPNAAAPIYGALDYDSDSDDDSDISPDDDMANAASNSMTQPSPFATNSRRAPRYQDEDYIFHESHPGDATIHPLLHKLAITLFQRKIPTDFLRDPFILFTVIEHTDSTDALRPIPLLPPALVRMKYGIRIVFFHEILNIWKAEALLGRTRSFAQITAAVMPWIRKDDPTTVFGWNHKELLLTSQMSKTVPRPIRFVPCDDTGSLFKFDGQLMDFNGIPIMAQAMLGMLEGMLLDILDGTHLSREELPNLRAIFDDHRCDSPRGYSIFTDPNKGLNNYRKVWLDKLVASRQYVVWRKGVTHYNKILWLKISEKIARFTELLCACDHLLNGGVTRGTSVSETTYANTSRGLRNYCLADGCGIYYSTISKVSNVLGFDLQSVRCQCYRLSYVTFLYILLIRPVDTGITLRFNLRPNVPKEQIVYLSNTYLYYASGRVLKTQNLSQILFTWTKEYLHVGLTTAGVRQLWAYLVDRFVPDIDLLDQCGSRLEAPGVTKELTPEESVEWYIKISHAYHVTLGIDQKRVCDIESTSWH